MIFATLIQAKQPVITGLSCEDIESDLPTGAEYLDHIGRIAWK